MPKKKTKQLDWLKIDYTKYKKNLKKYIYVYNSIIIIYYYFDMVRGRN